MKKLIPILLFSLSFITFQLIAMEEDIPMPSKRKAVVSLQNLSRGKRARSDFSETKLIPYDQNHGEELPVSSKTFLFLDDYELPTDIEKQILMFILPNNITFMLLSGIDCKVLSALFKQHALMRTLNKKAKSIVDMIFYFNKNNIIEQIFNISQLLYHDKILFKAARHGNILLFYSALKSAPKDNLSLTRNRHCLLIASSNNHLKLCEVLISNGAINTAENAPLITAICLKDENHVKHLIQIGKSKASLSYLVNQRFQKIHNEFTIAIACGDSKIFNLLLPLYSLTINHQNFLKSTPLHVSTEFSDNVEIVQLLLDKGANINARNQKLETPLCLAIQYDRLKTVQLLLDKNADIDAATLSGLTALHLAVQSNCLEKVQLLLDRGANINAAIGNGFTALHLAAQHDCSEIVKLLLERGANSNAMTKNGFTALHLAAQYDSLDIVELLLDRGANINTMTTDGSTALHVAAQYDSLEIVEILLKRGANINIFNKQYDPALHIAIQYGCFEIVELLLDKGATIYQITIHLAAQHNHVEIMGLLLDRGIDINAVTYNYGSIPQVDAQSPILHVAAQYDRFEIVQLLLDRGANINAVTRYGSTGPHFASHSTALHVAARYNRFEIVQLLLDRGVDINAVTIDGFTALDLAIRSRDLTRMQRLIEREAVNKKPLSKQEISAVECANNNKYSQVIELLKRGSEH